MTDEGRRTLVDFLIEQKKRNEKYFLEYRKYALRIKEITRKFLKEPRVLVFGSVARGTWMPNKSDIDILIISESVTRSANWHSETKIKILDELGDLSSPFELHFATPAEYDGWYRRFIKGDYVEV